MSKQWRDIEWAAAIITIGAICAGRVAWINTGVAWISVCVACMVAIGLAFIGVGMFDGGE